MPAAVVECSEAPVKHTFAVLYDRNIVAMYYEWVYVTQQGRACAYGTSQKVLTEQLIREMYGVKIWVHPGGESYPYIQYLR